jgi:hypothetical protein
MGCSCIPVISSDYCWTSALLVVVAVAAATATASTAATAATTASVFW